MKEKQEYLQDIQEIRSLMEKSTKFMSLSGVSGVLIGIYALLAAVIARYFLQFGVEEFINNSSVRLNESSWGVFYLAVVTLILSLATGYLYSRQKAAVKGERVWNESARKMMWHFLVPLIAGGGFMLILFFKGMMTWMPGLSLIFYGLALFSVSKYTFKELAGLGLLHLVLGLASILFPMWGLIFWAIGFGLGHIGYGLFLYKKYEQ